MTSCQSEVGVGSQVPWFQEPVSMFGGLDRFPGSEVPGTGSNRFQGLDWLKGCLVPRTGINVPRFG